MEKIDKKCSNNCSEHGVCLNDTFCLCDVRFDGISCEFELNNVELIEFRAKCYEKCFKLQKNNLIFCINECLVKSFNSTIVKKTNSTVSNISNSSYTAENSNDESNFIDFSSEN